MSERFPDFDLTPRKPKGWTLAIQDSEATPQAVDLISERLKEHPELKSETGQALWMKGRAIILEMVGRGEIVRVGLTWDTP